MLFRSKPEKITYDSTNQQMFFSFSNGYGYIDTNASSGNYLTAQDGEGSTGTYDIEYDSANDRVFLSRYLGDGGLGIIDTSSYGAVSTLTTGKTYQMKFVSELDRLYYSYGSDLRILDTSSDSVLKTISSVRSNDFSYDSVNEKIYAVPMSSYVAHVLSVRQSSDVVSINFDEIGRAHV